MKIINTIKKTFKTYRNFNFNDKNYFKFMTISNYYNYLIGLRIENYRIRINNIILFISATAFFSFIFNPIGRIKAYFSNKLDIFLKKTILSKETIDMSLKLVEKSFKKDELIKVQLDQLKNGFKSKEVIECSKDYGKKLIVNIFTQPNFIRFTKSYIIQIIKSPEIVTESSILFKKQLNDQELIGYSADLFKNALLKYDATFNAMIKALNDAGIKAAKNENMNSHYGKFTGAVVMSDILTNEIKKSFWPIF